MAIIVNFTIIRQTTENLVAAYVTAIFDTNQVFAFSALSMSAVWNLARRNIIDEVSMARYSYI